MGNLTIFLPCLFQETIYSWCGGGGGSASTTKNMGRVRVYLLPLCLVKTKL